MCEIAENADTALAQTLQHRCAVIWGVDSAPTIELCSTDALDAVLDQVVLSSEYAEDPPRATIHPSRRPA